MAHGEKSGNFWHLTLNLTNKFSSLFDRYYNWIYHAIIVIYFTISYTEGWMNFFCWPYNIENVTKTTKM